jgi:endoglycosylceramidase
LWLVALPACALAAPSLPLDHAGRWVTDAGGRVVVIHGINMVYKLPPYAPSAIGFDGDDAAFLQSIGFNVVRVGVIWKALEPRPGVYDDAYLNSIADTVAILARHGITSLLDFHQDQLSERFEGEGFPDWAVQDDGLPAAPKLGFGPDYLAMPALQHALDHFWANSPGPGGIGLQDRFAAAWRHVAQRFRGNRNVLGYELFNEPFAGTAWQPCAMLSGCQGFDATLGRFVTRTLAAIRAVDPRTLVWYEPNVLFNNGPDTRLPKFTDRRLGFAFHDYCLTEPQTGAAGCDTFDGLVFANAVKRAARTGDALLETEFGATDDIPYLNLTVGLADSTMVGWTEWHYCDCHDPTTSGPGAKQAIVLDPTKPPTGSNLALPTLRALVEPYPQVLSGTPQRWGFDAATASLSLRYSTARADNGGSFPAGSVTEVATPSFVYANGYAARANGAAIVSPRGAGVLQLAACPGATTISVTVSPSGSSDGSCRAGLRVAISPGSARLDRATTFTIRVVAVLGAFSRPVSGATVSFAGRHLRTDARGQAKVGVALHRHVRAYGAVARAAGFESARTVVRIAPPG